MSLRLSGRELLYLQCVCRNPALLLVLWCVIQRAAATACRTGATSTMRCTSCLATAGTAPTVARTPTGRTANAARISSIGQRRPTDAGTAPATPSASSRRVLVTVFFTDNGRFHRTICINNYGRPVE